MLINGIQCPDELPLIELSQVSPYLRNARINDETVSYLSEIIRQVGFNQPIVIDSKGVIVKGHARWKSAIRLGMDKIPCIVSLNDDDTNNLDRIADNKLAEQSKWNESLLVNELGSLPPIYFDKLPPLAKMALKTMKPVSMETNRYLPPTDDNGNFISQDSNFQKSVENSYETEKDFLRLKCPCCGTYFKIKRNTLEA